MGIAWLISGVLGFALGVVAGARRGGAVDRVVRGYCFLLASTPTFWLGLLILMIFAVQLGWFPIGFSVPIGVSAADVTLADAAHHLVLPALTLSVTGVANIALHTREKVVDVLESDYVRFARASRRIRAERGSCTIACATWRLPAVTLQCAFISEIFGGSVLVEQVFSVSRAWGRRPSPPAWAATWRFWPGIALVSAALVFGGNLLANILVRRSGPAHARRARGRA